jgi:hypothetical protein
MLMASFRMLLKVEPSVTSLEPCVADLQAHLFSIFSRLGLTENVLEIQLDHAKQDVMSLQVILRDDTIKMVDEQGAFQQRFAEALRYDNHLPPSSIRTVTAALEEAQQNRKYLTEKVVASEQIRCELVCAVECLAVLWCLGRLQVRSISYSPLPLHTHSLSYQSHSIYQGMTVLPTLSSEDGGCLVSDTAAILLKVLTQSTGNEPSAMQLLAVTKGTDEKFSASLSTSLVLGRLPARKTDPVYETSRGMTEELVVQPLQASSSPSLWNMDEMVLLETNIDDMTAEHLAFCMERLLQAGAADAWTTPIVMKKGRAGVTIHCLCHTNQCDTMLEQLFRHSTTLGVRITEPLKRASLRRKMLHVQTEWTSVTNEGRVGVKVGYLGDEIVSVKPEFDHCRVISAGSGISIQMVADQAKRRAQRLLSIELEAEQVT